MTILKLLSEWLLWALITFRTETLTNLEVSLSFSISETSVTEEPMQGKRPIFIPVKRLRGLFTRLTGQAEMAILLVITAD